MQTINILKPEQPLAQALFKEYGVCLYLWTIHCKLFDISINWCDEGSISTDQPVYYIPNIPNDFNFYGSDPNNDIIIPDNVIDLAQNRDNVRILLYHAMEPFSWNFGKDFNEWWARQFGLYNIPSKQFYYISGDMSVDDNGSANVLGVCIFEALHRYRYEKDNKTTDIPINTHGPYEKEFLCLNSKARASKMAIMFYLIKNDLIKKGFVSWLWNNSRHMMMSNDEIRYTLDKWKHVPEDEYEAYVYDDTTFDEYRTTLQDTYYSLKEWGGQDEDLSEFYSKSKYSLVTEVNAGNSILHITEKTFKPLQMGHPFIIQGNPGTLTYLQDLGYQTFNDMFDESYDGAHSSERTKHIIEQVMSDKKVTQDILDKCTFNQQHFYNVRPETKRTAKLIQDFLL
tara:strand:+ start:619 stop:1809 length:1191 start_codon:yes stop_codon:yes gene_type:complete